MMINAKTTTSVIVAGVQLLLLAQPVSAAPQPFLKTSGIDIRNDYGQGDIVPLRGVNLGSWLLMEPWECPMNSTTNLSDNWSAINTLTQRFGAATKDSLIATYQNAWLQASDFDNIAAFGMNVVRLPFWYLNVEDEAGVWRADAFNRLDWAVSNAWQRGIYTIIDFHGPHGGQTANTHTTGRRWPTAGLWSSTAEQDRMVATWQRVAAHYAGNPAVAGYDLLNEPIGAPSQPAYWTLMNRCYQTIRTNDPDHLIIIEGTFGSWNLSVLPDPATYGWTNIVYQLHVYPWSVWNDVTQLNLVADNTLQDWVSHQGWNVPCHVGEFNMAPEAAWKYAIELYSGYGMSWQMWGYKSTYTLTTTSWGVYDANGSITASPNLETDSISSISNKWAQWTTAKAFSLNQSHSRTLALPVAKDDTYTHNCGTALNVAAPGVLANDTHLNLGGAGFQLQAWKMADPAHGSVVLNPNGAFTYVPNSGYAGADSFRYKVWDGRVDSVRVATVTIQVIPTAQCSAVQLIWATQPGLATNGYPLGQQPVLLTADAYGDPSTNGLPATLNVTIVLSAGAGALLGTTNVNLGTAGYNGVAHFSDLQINTIGTNLQLTAVVTSFSNIVSQNLVTNGHFNSGSSVWTRWEVLGTASDAWENFEIPRKLNPTDSTYVPSLVGVYDGTRQLTLGANGTAACGAYQIVPAITGAVYTLTVQGGTENWWLPTGEIRLRFLGSSSNVVGVATVRTTDSIHNPNRNDVGVPYQNWSLMATSPPNATQVKVEVANSAGTGSAWFDNVALISTIRQPLLAAVASAPFTIQAPASQTNFIAGITDEGGGGFLLQFVGTPGARYYLQSTTNLLPPIFWEPVAESTNTVTNANGAWNVTVPNSSIRRFYRSATTNP